MAGLATVWSVCRMGGASVITTSKEGGSYRMRALEPVDCVDPMTDGVRLDDGSASVAMGLTGNLPVGLVLLIRLR
ncbi:hypothetical protein F4804DRAFT_311576 [Jackrogersella minutella]|nr:hypothetical protein F4804DRAFT_311576 [Jackrogersella minutella]